MYKEGDLIIGYKLKIKSHHKYIYFICSICGREGWKQAVGTPPRPRFPGCKTCTGKENAERKKVNPKKL